MVRSTDDKLLIFAIVLGLFFGAITYYSLQYKTPHEEQKITLICPKCPECPAPVVKHDICRIHKNESMCYQCAMGVQDKDWCQEQYGFWNTPNASTKMCDDQLSEE